MPMLRELVHNLAQGKGEPPPIAKLIGFTVTLAQAGKAIVEFDASERHHNPMGTLHGGVLCDIADAAMGMAYASNLEEGESFTTLELKINFVKPVWSGHLRGTAIVIKQGKTVEQLKQEKVLAGYESWGGEGKFITTHLYRDTLKKAPSYSADDVVYLNSISPGDGVPGSPYTTPLALGCRLVEEPHAIGCVVVEHRPQRRELGHGRLPRPPKRRKAK